MFCVQAFPWLTQATTAGNSHATMVHWWLQVLLTISHNRPMQNVFRCFNLDRISMKLPNQGFQYLPISFSIFQYLPIVMHNNHNAACSLISSNIDPWLQTKVFTDSSQSQPSSSWLWQPVAPPDSAWGCAPALADLPDMTMAIAVGFFLRSLCKWLHMMWVGSPNHSDPLEIFTTAQTRRLRGGDLSPHHSVSQNRDEELMQGMLHNSLSCKREWIAVCGFFCCRAVSTGSTLTWQITLVWELSEWHKSL